MRKLKKPRQVPNLATSQTPYLESEMNELREQRLTHDLRAKAYPRLLDRVNELEQQRDAALKLADKWDQSVPDRHALKIVVKAFADELRAVFSPKEGK